MFEIRITAEARAGFVSLPLGIQQRMQDVFQRLTAWQNVSGKKAI
jgi:hypothetical protein